MEITTARLTLREFSLNDIPTVVAYQRDPRYARFYPESWTNRSDEEIGNFVRVLIGYGAQDPRRKFQLAITLASSRTLIGNVGVRRKDDNDWEADIGYELDPEYWNYGYASEAARAIVDFGFRELALHRISATCVAENVASVRVLERIGLRQEGRRRERDYFRGRWWDMLEWGVLDREWHARRVPGANTGP